MVRTFQAKKKSAFGAKIEDGRTELNDDSEKKRGRPRTSHTDDNCTIVERLIREDRRITVCEIAAMTGIPKSCVHKFKKSYVVFVECIKYFL
ncbi:hypothetical protein ILUMI_07172 [Ignelater luminosus]|uniref:HTH iclR-type domain-containing protein n=1 Tax=Ignelater luminosus TaxID=2038154 RepID=A0A8K0DE18_IGNLU|nr:hypothetical protein ILUMI_07172 [Ignelater luminosus]